MKNLLFAIPFVLYTLSGNAQSTYTQASITYAAPARQATNVSTTNCNDCGFTLNIGFTFNFFGNKTSYKNQECDKSQTESKFNNEGYNS